mmetsp:Transcript_15817/g.33439  ORF Transcript_15817/g.33439 Transcript_15817/m.33439 type:complete len:214 (+) Transcript_15817:146-787(+)
MMEDISLRTVESSSSKNDNDAAQVASAPAPSNANTGFSKMGRKIFSATLCCYTACDFEDPMVGCRGKSDGICINRRVCIDPSAEGFGVGILDDEKETNELFKVGAYCCTCAIKKPELKCASAGRLFCMTSAQSLPFDPGKKQPDLRSGSVGILRDHSIYLRRILISHFCTTRILSYNFAFGRLRERTDMRLLFPAVFSDSWVFEGRTIGMPGS